MKAETPARLLGSLYFKHIYTAPEKHLHCCVETYVRNTRLERHSQRWQRCQKCASILSAVNVTSILHVREAVYALWVHHPRRRGSCHSGKGHQVSAGSSTPADSVAARHERPRQIVMFLLGSIVGSLTIMTCDTDSAH